MITENQNKFMLHIVDDGVETDEFYDTIEEVEFAIQRMINNPEWINLTEVHVWQKVPVELSVISAIPEDVVVTIKATMDG